MPDGDQVAVRISVATRDDFDELLPLVRAYCDFYDVSSSDEDLFVLFEVLVCDP